MASIDPFGLFFGTNWVALSVQLLYRTGWSLGAFLTIPPLLYPRKQSNAPGDVRGEHGRGPNGGYLSGVSSCPGLF
jgi:hypothetical protein